MASVLDWIGEQHGSSRSAASAVARAEAYLASRQAPDGHWRDYWLLHGQSEDWVTACCGLALAQPPRQGACGRAVEAAARALRRAARPGGWGYHRDSVPDADSSAWAVRFLATAGWLRKDQYTTFLQQYLDERGRAHTFLPSELAGRWGDAHADVTPVVGLALLAAAVDSTIVRRIREGVIEGMDPQGFWPSYWWTTDTYATARSLEFLASSGGVPEAILARTPVWLGSQTVTDPPFVVAQGLTVATLIGFDTEGWLDALLELQKSDGSWPPSSVLLVPDKEGGAAQGAAHADEERMLGTAMAVMAVKTWLRQMYRTAQGAAHRAPDSLRP